MVPASTHAAADALQIVHVDEALVIVDKPAGQLAVPGRGADKLDCTWTRVRALHGDALVVHRLDQATSGLMLFARGPQMQRRASRAFALRQVDKRYIAIVSGLVRHDEGCIELPLAADWPNRPRQHVDEQSGKAAITHWRVLQRDPLQQRTRLELQPLTGRTHQLRVHLAAIGHAIVGDALYAGGSMPRDRLLLHASALRLAHPRDGGALSFSGAPPF